MYIHVFSFQSTFQPLCHYIDTCPMGIAHTRLLYLFKRTAWGGVCGSKVEPKTLGHSTRPVNHTLRKISMKRANAREWHKKWDAASINNT